MKQTMVLIGIIIVIILGNMFWSEHKLEEYVDLFGKSCDEIGGQWVSTTACWKDGQFVDPIMVKEYELNH